jgi:DNA sulfur modification protein DndD
MPYYGDTSITFADNDRKNVTVINGANMRGKTSLLNALRWVFYGKAINRARGAYDEFVLINKVAAEKNDWEMYVHVTFESNGHVYELNRRVHQRFMKIIPTSSNELAFSVMLKKDGTVLPQEQIELEIGRVVPEQTSRFFLFDGELLAEYEVLVGEESSQAREIKKAIEGVLGVPALIFGRNCTSGLLKVARTRMNDDAQKVRGLESHRAIFSKLENEIDVLEKRIVEYRNQLDDTSRVLSKVSSLVEAAESTYAAKVRRDSTKRELDSAQRLLDELFGKRKEYFKDAWREVLRPKLTVIQSELEVKSNQQLELLREKSLIESKISDLVKSKNNKTCRVCNNRLTDQNLGDLGHELGSLEAKLAGLSIDFDAMSAISSQKSLVNRLLKSTMSSQIVTLKGDITTQSISVSELESELSNLDKEIAEHDIAEISRNRVQRDRLLEHCGKLKTLIATDEQNRDNKKKDLLLSSQTIKARLNDQTQHENSVMAVTKLETLEKVYEVSIGKLREKLRRKVEQEASSAFKHLTTQENYSGLRINQNYGLTIYDHNENDVQIRSAGAEQIVALSLISGLTNSATNSMPIVMDTPFGRLDPGHRRNILRYLPTSCNQLILLVHDGELDVATINATIPDRVGNIYRIINVNHVHSRIESSSI